MVPSEAPATPDERQHGVAAEKVNKAGYWDAIYEAETRPRWDLGDVAPPLKHWLEHARPQPGRVLIPGCGFGHDVRLLAERGFEAVGVDFADRAIARALELHANAPGTPRFRQADIFDLAATDAGAFDYVYEYTCFVAIHPQRRAEYARLVHRVLRPGGRLIGCFYNHGRPGGPPYDATREHVLAAFAKGFRIEKLEVSPHSVERRQGHELWAEFVREPA